MVVQRTVGAAECGERTIAGAVCGMAAALAGLGLATLITKEIARDRDGAHGYMQSGATAAHLLIIVPMVLMTASFSVLAERYSSHTLTLIAILTLGVVSGFLAHSVSRSDCIRVDASHRARHISSLRRRRLANC